MIDDFQWLFPVKITSGYLTTSGAIVQSGQAQQVGSLSGTWLYNYIEQSIDPNTGVYLDAQGARQADANLQPFLTEINNQQVPFFPYYAWAKLRCIASGDPVEP